MNLNKHYIFLKILATMATSQEKSSNYLEINVICDLLLVNNIEFGSTVY